MRTRRAPVAFLVVALALVAWLGALAASAVAHPLGNFTINHYAGLRVSPESVALDVVIDYAEIPAFQERQRVDADGDGDVSEAEAGAAREPRCRDLATSLSLSREGTDLELRVVGAGLTFPPGAGGLATMRLVCEYRAEMVGGLTTTATLSFEDRAYAERIGWREIIVLGDRTAIGDSTAVADTSARLTSYPADLLAQPLDVRSVSFTVAPGGAPLEPFVAPDATSLDGSPAATSPPAGFDPRAVPGGVGADIPELFRSASLTPILAAASILLAAALGAGHALTPGHGKTLMAAYLVGRRGTIRHAIGLGLSVTVSHTLGILVLALLVTGAEAALPADVVVRTVPVLAALGFVGIGAWMIASEVRRRRAASANEPHTHDHEPHTHEPFEHEHPHDAEHEHGHPHEHDHEPELDHDARLEHAHGGLRHRHGLAAGEAITWRSLFALGLAGGIIPSTNALIILLGALVAGRAAFGVVLVIAFGLGMALVLGGVGVALVLVRGRLERVPSSPRLGAALANAPLVASVLVFGIGLWLTAQSLTGLPTL